MKDYIRSLIFCVLLLGLSSEGAASTVRGLYVGSEFYTLSGRTPEAARASGFNRIFVSFFKIDPNGDIALNDIPLVQKGVYIGDPTWGAKLAALKTPPSSISRIELVFGGPDDASFSNIKNLIAAHEPGQGNILYQNLKALQNAIGVDAIQFADEQTHDVPSLVAFGEMVADLGMKITLAPKTDQVFWVNVESKLSTNIDSVFLQCYKQGSTNDPASWISALHEAPIYPGLWGNVDTLVTAMRKMRAWRQSLGINGGFVWLNGHMPADASKWADALWYGLGPIPNFQIINKGSGKPLNLIDGSTTDGSSISQTDYGDSNNQRWMLVPIDDGAHFKIISWVSGQAASIAKDSLMVRVPIWSWDYETDPSQQFDLENMGDGWFKIQNVRSGLFLEVAGSSTSSYLPVQQNIETESANQLWKFLPYQDIVPILMVQPSANLSSEDIFRRVKVLGQVLCGSDRNYYLIDGSTGLRVTLNKSSRFEAGDTVCVTGLVFSLNQFVELIEATAFKTGHLALPQPHSLGEYSATPQSPWVWTEGILVGSKNTANERVFELQAGFKTFDAKLDLRNEFSKNLTVGSRLKVTGIYLPYIGRTLSQANGNSFEIKLNSASAIEILTRPPVWTLRHLIIVVGVLLTVLILTFVWVTSLRRQVGQQSNRLKQEITQHQQAEQARVIEEERSRISQDLHDDLGSILTQINMLANSTNSMNMTSELARERVQLIADKSHHMIVVLDEVVWMMNSKEEDASSIVTYIASYTQEFLSKTNIVCRLETPIMNPKKTVPAEVRNNLFSAVKEAISNAARHAKPSQILLEICVLENDLKVLIHDDGCGFDPELVKRGKGLTNLRERMHKINGSCQIQSSVQSGTTIVLRLPLA